MTKLVGSEMTMLGLQFLLLDKTGVNQEFPSLTDKTSSYVHTIDSFGGFLDAVISFTLTKKEAELLFYNSIGKQVKLTCNAGRIAWEGFVNAITIRVGGLSETVGPLLDATNYLWCVCSPMDYSVEPPSAGSSVTLPYVSDSVSIEKYGILEKVLSMGQCSIAMATYAQAVAIQDLAYPKVSGPLSFEGSTAEITFNCLGNVHWLYAYIYDNATAGDTTADAKIISILGADPNGYISTDYSRIYSNAISVGIQEREHRYAADVIKEIITLGDYAVPGLRTLFGIYENRKAIYAVAPSTIEYEHHLSWNEKRVENYLGGTKVVPWLVRPGKWLLVPDFMPQIRPPTNLNTDPRTKFIETAKYTAPLSLDLSGGKLDRLSSLLARLTYSSGSAGGG